MSKWGIERWYTRTKSASRYRSKSTPLRQNASSIDKELHRRILALEEALRATTSSHPLISTSHRSISANSDLEHLNSPTHGPLSSFDRQSGDGAVDSLSGYSHLIVEEDPGRSKYYGAASSVYLTVRPFPYHYTLDERLMIETIKHEPTTSIHFHTGSPALV